MKKLKWGILGTGRIAKIFAKGVQSSESGELVAVGSRSRETADSFGQIFGITRCHENYEALLKDSMVEAIYISLPHPMHAEWAVKVAEAGKHILCEKPAGLTQSEAYACIEAARVNDVFFMEAFMYRCHPQTRKLVELIQERAIGDVRLIQASFGFHAGLNPEGRLFKNELGGGAILDVGCYATSMAILIASAAGGKECLLPKDVKGSAFLGSTKVDEWAAATLFFPNNIIAQVSTGVSLSLENSVRIFGTEGSIYVPHPWVITGKELTIVVNRKGKSSETFSFDQGNVYSLEADAVANNLDQRQAPFPCMTHSHTLANLKVMDDWRNSIGLQYEVDKIEGQKSTVTGRPLKKKLPCKMTYRTFPGSSKKVSRLVMGSTIPTPQHLAFIFDSFFEAGGTAFDTAYGYGEAKERSIGQWLVSRQVREEIFLLGKGAHTPHCNPKDLTKQLFQSLDRLKTDYLDLYLMHRDNPDIPVGEFIDVLNEHHRAGRIRAFGGSNWSLQRIDEANAYAKQKGLIGMSALSNQFSLAEMMQPVWADALSCSDDASREWLKQSRMPLFAWSSQARGFFTERGDPERKDPEMVRCWISERNLKRRDRTIELARQKGVLPLNVALAYVLQQDLPLFALVGPLNQEEVRTTLQVLDVNLTKDEMAWLNLETDETINASLKQMAEFA